MSLDPGLRARIDSLLQENRVVLFMKGSPDMPQCGFSAKAAGILGGLDVPFAHVNVLADAEIREGIKIYGSWPTIPQLYIGGELVGGSDIIEEMAESGELNQALGLPPPDRSPPANVTMVPEAAQMLRQALADAGPDMALALSIDAAFQPRFQIVPHRDNAIAVECEGLRIQFDTASARRADNITIGWVDDMRGRGLAIDNPNAPDHVAEITPAQAAERVGAGTLTLVDVRPAAERELASVAVPFRVLDGEGRTELEAMPRDTPLAFLCHTGRSSRAAAAHFKSLGFENVHNVTGGIHAWSRDVDPGVPTY